MNRRSMGVILILSILLMTPLQGIAATPKETVEASVNQVLSTLSDPAFKAKSKDERIAIISSKIETVFDFEELSKRTLGREWKKMKPEQQIEFVALFKELLKGVYADRLLAIRIKK